MVPNVLFYQLFVVALVVICLLIHVWWRDAPSASPPTALTPDTPRRKRSTEPKPFPGFIHIPLCAGSCTRRRRIIREQMNTVQ
jgi:hypothetical protein